jgi:hypothetical protein
MTNGLINLDRQLFIQKLNQQNVNLINKICCTQIGKLEPVCIALQYEN